MQFYYVYAASAILIALGYMLFDVLNRREVPNLFVGATLAFSFALILFTQRGAEVVQSFLIAFVILGGGYFIYRIGQLGLGDVFEFAALSLLLAPLASPLLAGLPAVPQLPTVLALFLNTGIAAIIVVPIIYTAVVIRRFGARRIVGRIGRSELIKVVTIVATYLVFAAFVSQLSHSWIALFSLMILLVFGSVLLLLFQRPMTEVMVERVGYEGFVEDDIIAFNLMSGREISSAKRKISSFDRLVTRKMISEMKAKKLRQKFPVYKRAVPFAVPIFIGTVLVILFGNVLILALVG